MSARSLSDEDVEELQRPPKTTKKKKKKSRQHHDGESATTTASSAAASDNLQSSSDAVGAVVDEDDEHSQKRLHPSTDNSSSTTLRVKRTIVGIGSPVFWLTRIVVLPWLYHATHRPTLSALWTIIAAPFMLALLVADFVLTLLYAIFGWFFPLLFYGAIALVTVGCFWQLCRYPSFARRTYRAAFVDVWVDAFHSFTRAYGASGTLFENRLLDLSREERDDETDEQRRFGGTVSLLYGQVMYFALTRAIFCYGGVGGSELNNDDNNDESKTSMTTESNNNNKSAGTTTTASSTTTTKAGENHSVAAQLCYYFSFLMLPVVVLIDLVTFLLWWLVSIVSFPIFPFVFLITAGCCHSKWTSTRYWHYFCYQNLALLYALLVFLSITLARYANAALAGFIFLLVTIIYIRGLVNWNSSSSSN